MCVGAGARGGGGIHRQQRCLTAEYFRTLSTGFDSLESDSMTAVPDGALGFLCLVCWFLIARAESFQMCGILRSFALIFFYVALFTCIANGS